MAPLIGGYLMIRDGLLTGDRPVIKVGSLTEDCLMLTAGSKLPKEMTVLSLEVIQ